ncbi:MAG: hypothetical protein HXS48_12320 [Theionarchaea archaeon]|nr:hypothetical protein [Theionarchaea archaeon]
MKFKKEILIGIVMISVILISACVEEEEINPAVEEYGIKNEKLGIYVTSDIEENEIWPTASGYENKQSKRERLRC